MEQKQTPIWDTLPKQVSLKHFNQYIKPHLSKRHHGPHPKISSFKTFNDILRVLHTGIQWNQLKTNRNEIHWSNVYKWHHRWSKDGTYERLHAASVIHLVDTDQLDLSLLHGDGSNTVTKKGAVESATPATSTRRGKKS